MLRILISLSVIFHLMSSTAHAAPPSPAIPIDEVNVYEVIKGTSTITCAESKSTPTIYKHGIIKSAAAATYQESLTFVPADEQLRRLKRRARRAQGSSRTKLERRVRSLQKKINVCRKGRGFVPKRIEAFACDFRTTVKVCEPGQACYVDVDGGMAGEGSTVAAAYHDGLFHCNENFRLFYETLDKVNKPIFGQVVDVVPSPGCELIKCDLVPEGMAWNFWICAAQGGVRECVGASSSSSACEGGVRGGDGGMYGKAAAMETALQNCQEDIQGWIDGQFSEPNVSRTQTHACSIYDCTRYLSSKE